jgi:phosphoserine phosphatase
MRGDLALEEVYGRRLELVRPTRERMEALGRQYVERLVPDAREVVGALLAEGVDVRIVSGGLLPAVRAVGRELGLEDGAIAAVDLCFDEAGGYAGFDDECPLAYSGGKREQLLRWLPALPAPVMMVGDGVTDLEARPPADLFVAYAGVVARPAVIAEADVVVRSRSLAPILTLALGDEGPADTRARALYERGRALLAEQG